MMELILHKPIFNLIHGGPDLEVRDFEKGDLVAVFGGKLDEDSQEVDAVSFCRVLVVGQEDLVVESESHYLTKNTHVVSKKICKTLELDPEVITSAETMEPLIGDLVVSFRNSYDNKKIETKTGILTKITFRLGKPESCEILCGTEAITVNWPSLIVAKRKQ